MSRGNSAAGEIPIDERPGGWYFIISKLNLGLGQQMPEQRKGQVMAKVIVGMSGGVDSAVTALLLKEAGYEVEGVTLRTWDTEETEVSRCCEIDGARETAEKLGIPFHVLNVSSAFKKNVTEPFIREYLRGRTPNPCVFCNRAVKWEWLIYMANVLQADYVATGHYAEIRKLPNGRYTVRKAAYAPKDQTYMLYRLSQEQLSRTIMPLGTYDKNDVRKIAADAGLPSASSPDSQEICFVTEGHYADYIREHAKDPVPGAGNYVDETGQILGQHKGIIHYTIGQRKGLGLAMGHPVYVQEVRPGTNEVVIGEEDGLFHTEILCEDLNFLSIPELSEGEKIRAQVKIRYAHKGEMAELEMQPDGRLKLSFEAPVRAASPGQSAVFYDEDDCLIGGGVIAEVR